MDESEFWGQLEFRVCREIQEFAQPERRNWWCDGFVPERYDTSRGLVLGTVWMGRTGSGHQEIWEFVLKLEAPTESREQIVWATLFPAEERRGWLKLDARAKMLTLEL